jgi:hypothetical protein
VSQLHLIIPNHVQTNDKIKNIQVDDLNRDHSFKITTNRYRDLDRTHGKLRSDIVVLYRDILARRFKTQLVDKERFTTEGRGGTSEDSNAKCKGDLVGLDGTSPKRALASVRSSMRVSSIIVVKLKE